MIRSGAASSYRAGRGQDSGDNRTAEPVCCYTLATLIGIPDTRSLETLRMTTLEAVSLGRGREAGDIIRIAPLGRNALPDRASVERIPVRVRRGHALFREGDRLDCLYRVHAGEFKLLRIEEDGFEQVLDFVGTDEVLGLDGLHGGRFRASAVALEDSLVIALPVGSLTGPGSTLAGLEGRIRATFQAQSDRLVDVSWLMAAVGAERRTARFLVLMSRRMARRGLSPTRFVLRMRRRDIASYLGLSHESISRSFTMLARADLLRVDGRQVEILDPAGLQRLARVNRGGADAPHHETGRRACATMS
jgi:CRP/FNR family transcriptional regulator